MISWTAWKLEIPLDSVTEKWFAPRAFDATNTEARDILLISTETGCRQSEIHDLPASAIVLVHPVPHLQLAFEQGENRWLVSHLQLPSAMRMDFRDIEAKTTIQAP